MRRLWPDPSPEEGEVDDVAALIASEDRTPPGDRPWLLVNMVASLDGGVTVEGRSGGLAGAADKELFGALRQVGDIVLAGAGTARAEDYGPPKATDGGPRAPSRSWAAGGASPRRRVTAARPRPRRSPVLGPDNRPYVITHTAAPADRRAELADVADVVAFGEDEVDLVAALAHLRSEGPRWSPARAGRP